MPLKYWWEACFTSTFLINRLPTKVLNFLSPVQKLFHKNFDFSLLKCFGCACFPFLRPYRNKKFSFHSEKCVFIGYSPHHKGYRCLSLTSGKTYISSNVIFHETSFPFAKVHESKVHGSHTTPTNSPTCTPSSVLSPNSFCRFINIGDWYKVYHLLHPLACLTRIPPTQLQIQEFWWTLSPPPQHKVHITNKVNKILLLRILITSRFNAHLHLL